MVRNVTCTPVLSLLGAHLRVYGWGQLSLLVCGKEGRGDPQSIRASESPISTCPLLSICRDKCYRGRCAAPFAQGPDPPRKGPTLLGKDRDLSRRGPHSPCERSRIPFEEVALPLKEAPILFEEVLRRFQRGANRSQGDQLLLEGVRILLRESNEP